VVSDSLAKSTNEAAISSVTNDFSLNHSAESYPDIFKLLASPAARHLNLYSTCDLFDRKPQIIELFATEEYDLFLPYLRFLPVGAEPDTRPEDAASSICPFLYPIADVFAFHKLQLRRSALAIICLTL
jgi:hypothetical protein